MQAVTKQMLPMYVEFHDLRALNESQGEYEKTENAGDRRDSPASSERISSRLSIAG